MTKLLLNRRGAIASLLAISATSALSACGNADTHSRGTVDAGLKYASVGQFFSANEMAMLGAIAGTIMPATNTPGAVEAGVPAVVQELASVWGNDDYRRYWRAGLSDMAKRLQDADRPFVDMTADQKTRALGTLDADVFNGSLDIGFYRDLKSTVLQAYYMSEPGATEELAYEPVPGEWVGCVPLSQYPKSWAR